MIRVEVVYFDVDDKDYKVVKIYVRDWVGKKFGDFEAVGSIYFQTNNQSIVEVEVHNRGTKSRSLDSAIKVSQMLKQIYEAHIAGRETA